jgi:hypothetical protein
MEKDEIDEIISHYEAEAAAAKAVEKNEKLQRWIRKELMPVYMAFGMATALASLTPSVAQDVRPQFMEGFKPAAVAVIDNAGKMMNDAFKASNFSDFKAAVTDAKTSADMAISRLNLTDKEKIEAHVIIEQMFDKAKEISKDPAFIQSKRSANKTESGIKSVKPQILAGFGPQAAALLNKTGDQLDAALAHGDMAKIKDILRSAAEAAARMEKDNSSYMKIMLEINKMENRVTAQTGPEIGMN